jgi:predicted nuclease of predicted toxin-antitoxin system
VAVVKLDENVPDSVAGILRQGGHDVALARDQDLVGAGDDRVLMVASEEGRILVSLDRDFANILRHPPEQAGGIIVIRLHEQTLPAVRSVATTLCELLTRETVQGRLWVIDESRLRIWPREGKS